MPQPGGMTHIKEEVGGGGGTFDEEGVLYIPGRVLLRLKQGVKIPERTLYVVVSWHFSKAIQKKNP